MTISTTEPAADATSSNRRAFVNAFPVMVSAAGDVGISVEHCLRNGDPLFQRGYRVFQGSRIRRCRGIAMSETTYPRGDFQVSASTFVLEPISKLTSYTGHEAVRQDPRPRGEAVMDYLLVFPGEAPVLRKPDNQLHRLNL